MIELINELVSGYLLWIFIINSHRLRNPHEYSN